MTRRGCLVAIGLFLGLVPAARAGDVTFVSDSSWNVYTPLVTVAPMPGQLGSYDGTAEYVLVNSVYPTTRPPGAIIYDPSLSNPGWTANLSSIPGAYWIWAPGITPKTLGASYAEYQFARTFDLTGTTFSGSISVAVDDFAQVYVNGHLAGSTGSITDESAAYTAQLALATFDLGPYLVQGLNTIEVLAQNGPSTYAGYPAGYDCDYAENLAGVVFGGTIGGQSVPEPSSMVLIGLGGCGLFLFRRSRSRARAE